MKKEIKEFKYQHPASFSGHTIRLIQNGNRYLVAHYLPGGEDLYPHGYRYSNLAAAEAQIEDIEAHLIEQGYEVSARYYF